VQERRTIIKKPVDCSWRSGTGGTGNEKHSNTGPNGRKTATGERWSLKIRDQDCYINIPKRADENLANCPSTRGFKRMRRTPNKSADGVTGTERNKRENERVPLGDVSCSAVSKSFSDHHPSLRKEA